MKSTTGSLILIRHAKAEPQEDASNDAQRKLTKRGRKEFNNILPNLKAHLEQAGQPVELQLLSSPLLRAVQTAKMVAAHLGIEEVQQLEWIGDGDYQALQEQVADLELSSSLATPSLAIVGHEPYLSAWSQKLSGCSIPFRKGAAVEFRITEQQPLRAEPVWLLMPDTLDEKKLNIKPRQPAASQFKKILRCQFHTIFNKLQDFISTPEQPEAAHQFRVKIRTFRSMLFFFKPLLELTDYQTAQNQMKKLAQLMGSLREIDVLQEEWLQVLKAEPQLVEGQSILTDTLMAERQEEQTKICQAAPDMTQVIFDVWNRIELASLPASHINQSFSDFVNKRLKKQLRKAEAGLEKLDYSDFDSVHSLRIQFKKLRYAFSALSPFLNMKKKKPHSSFKFLQEIFGEYCDTQRNLAILKQLNVKYDKPQLHVESAAFSSDQMYKAEEKLQQLKRTSIDE